ncbi:MAG: hypothetical protein JXB05_10800 [Myxococcaceae bacterium]|nr:hypothetical protein [Myxococcaceae bacterium]
MAVPQHLDEAAARLNAASLRIEAARGLPTSTESLRDWLEALTDYARALAELHEYTNESVHEKLHELAGHLGLKDIPRISAFTPH